MLGSFWGDEIDKYLIESDKKNKKILEKLKSPMAETKTTAQQLKNKKLSLIERLDLIKKQVVEVLGMHKEDIQVIDNENDLMSFINKAIDNGVLAYDTETNNSLDYLTCKIVGLCLYTPGEKAAYVPIYHLNPDTDELIDGLVSKEVCRRELLRCVNNSVKFIMHNGKFDYQVTKCFLHLELPIEWDTMVASRMINENDEAATLKWQYHDKCDPEHPVYDIDEMFPGIDYVYLDPNVFVYYAAIDALMTYKLYAWQKIVLTTKDEENVLKLLYEVEFPLIIAVAEMELRGVYFDKEYCGRLHDKYHGIVSHYDELIAEELNKLQDRIDAWRLTPEANYTIKKRNKKGEEVESKSKSEQLETPINLESPTQLAILLYDILGAQPVDGKPARSVDKKTLPVIAKRDKIQLCNLILERKAAVTLLNDFIDKLPSLVNPVDGAIHCNFNQCGKEEDGVVTGRFSSSNPNLQQIPSKNVEIRPVFTARPGYVFVGGDFSAQEPRLTAFYSQDKDMLKAYEEGRDLYSVIASVAFDKPYEECLEFYPEGTKITFEGQEIITGHKTHTNEEGKHRRSAAKAILLGLIYGRGASSVGEQIGKSYKEAQDIIDTFFKSFPSVKKWIDSTHEKAHKLEYVEDWFGRKRHLPNINLPKYSISYKNGKEIGSYSFNPIIGCKGRPMEDTVSKKWLDECYATKSKRDAAKVIADAEKAGYLITDNTGIIAKAERQSVNSIVQGGAATLTKMAMNNLYRDPVLRELDFHMIITVHDEVLGECPEENAEKVAERMAQIMIDTSKPYMNVPMSVDCEVGSKWYIGNYNTHIQKEYKNLVSGDDKKGIAPLSPKDAFNKVVENHPESLRGELHKMLFR